MKLTTKFSLFIAAALLLARGAFAQTLDTSGALDTISTSVRHAGDANGPQMTFGEFVADNSSHGPLGHPYRLEAFHPSPECLTTESGLQKFVFTALGVNRAYKPHIRPGCKVKGEKFFQYDGFNLRTTAGTNWQSQIMLDTSTPAVNAQCNYLALTNTAVTPAEADTTLSGEINTNGLSRAQATYTNNSTTLAVPSAPTVTPQGSAGSTTYYYWVLAGNQGIYTTLSASGTTATANATLTGTNSVQVTWTPIAGAANYYVFRTTSSSAPTGANTTVGGLSVTGQPSCSAATCYIYDSANSLAGPSITIPGSNLTNYGTMTLVHTWTATGSQSSQAFGVFTAASTGTLCFEGTYTSVALNSGDTLQLTETVVF